MNDILSSGDVPEGLGMALAQNLNAMNVFASMSKSQQEAVINGTHQIRSKREMKSYVDNIANNSFR